MSQADSGKFRYGRAKRKPNPTSERYPAPAASGEYRSAAGPAIIAGGTRTRGLRGARGLASGMALLAISGHGDWNCFSAWRPLALHAVRHEPAVGEHADRNSTAYSSRSSCIDYGAHRE